MNRRNFLSGILASGVVIGTGGLVWLGNGSDNKSLTIKASLQTLDRLMNAEINTLGDWDIYQILVHAAQSIEFSMTDFPEHKSALFKGTAGKLAFAAFSVKGEMTHGLSEAIPGAPAIEAEGDINYAYQRLKQSMINFANYKGPLAEHFAYGALEKWQYEQAHAMHFYNHLLEVELES
jgi:hypothetical protein